MTATPEGRLAGKVAIVTGASRGIGGAIAQRFVAEGASVLNASLIEPTYQADGIMSMIADVSDPAAVQAVVQAAVDAFGRIDVVVNNAGIELEASIAHTEPDQWDRIMAVNARGPFLCSKYALPHLSRSKGVIINIASVDSYWGEPDLAAYCASKAAVLGLTRCIALDHARDGVRAVAICPGYVRTELLEHFYDNQPDPTAAGEPHTDAPPRPHLRAGGDRKPRVVARVRRGDLRIGPAVHPRRRAHGRSDVRLGAVARTPPAAATRSPSHGTAGGMALSPRFSGGLHSGVVERIADRPETQNP